MLNQDLEKSPTILPTAITTLLDDKKEECPARWLIDSCAEERIVCKDIVQKLRLTKHKRNLIICSIVGITGKAISL
jgi:hypothetical protein